MPARPPWIEGGAEPMWTTARSASIMRPTGSPRTC